MRRYAGISWLVLATAACGVPLAGPDGGPPPTDEPTTALFELPAEGVPESDYYALPFPNDLRVRADGTLDLDAHVKPNALLELYMDVIASRFAGFGTNSAMFVRFDGAIDPATLPATPEDALDPAASVYLVDVDPDSPERGTRRPLRFRFEPFAGESIGTDWLACLPYPGFTLRPKTTYALVVTNRLHGANRGPVQRPASLDDVLATNETYRPLSDWLAEPGGDEDADVVSAAVFTTQDPTALLGRMRAVTLAAVPPPALAGTHSTGTNATFTTFEATVDLPVFQAGTSPYLSAGGEILVDADGNPIVQGSQAVDIALTFPAGAVPAGGWPVVLYAHGTGGDRKSFVRDGTAARFAAHGFAVMGADQVLNGTRIAGGGSPDLLFYNFQNPLAGRDNSRQGGAELFQLARLVDPGRVAIADGNRTHTLDPDRLYFMGHSQGGITGPLGFAYEPRLRGAIFSGSGGLLYWALLLKTEPIDIPSLLASFVRDYPLDEFNNLLALVQLFIEPADPINYARLITHEPPPGVPLRDVFQSQGLIDHYTPPPAIEALGVALGGSPIAPLIDPLPGFELAGRPVLEPPVTANLGERTVVFHQYNAAADSDGHFVVFDDPVAERQSIEFLITLDRDGVATLVP